MLKILLLLYKISLFRQRSLSIFPVGKFLHKKIIKWPSYVGVSREMNVGTCTTIRDCLLSWVANTRNKVLGSSVISQENNPLSGITLCLVGCFSVVLEICFMKAFHSDGRRVSCSFIFSCTHTWFHCLSSSLQNTLVKNQNEDSVRRSFNTMECASAWNYVHTKSTAQPDSRTTHLWMETEKSIFLIHYCKAAPSAAPINFLLTIS